jgi:hypothetical protein
MIEASARVGVRGCVKQHVPQQSERYRDFDCCCARVSAGAVGAGKLGINHDDGILT